MAESSEKTGLFYRRSDGAEVPIGDKNTDVYIAIMNPEGTCSVSRFYRNEFNCGYRPVSREVGALYMQALISGFEPPRCLEHLDKPAHETLPGNFEVPVFSRGESSSR